MKKSASLTLVLLGFAALAGCIEYDPSAAYPPTGPATGGAVNGQASSALSQQEINDFMAVHNQARMEVGVPPLTYSPGLAAFAQQWADNLASSGCLLRHRPQSGYGENIAMLAGGSAGAGQAARNWYSEKSSYYGGPITAQNLMSVGHYTQMVWRGSTQVGCGKAVCANGMVIYVANYSPQGNMLNQNPY